MRERAFVYFLAFGAIVVVLGNAKQLLAAAGPAVAVVLLVGIAAVCLRRKPAMGRLAGGRIVTVKGHNHGGLRKFIARHEGGHAVAARALGGRVLSAEMSDGDGIVHARIPGDPTSVVTFLLAGQMAVGSSNGASYDNDQIRKELRTVPSAERAHVRADAKRAAKKIVSQRSGEIRKFAVELSTKGRI